MGRRVRARRNPQGDRRQAQCGAEKGTERPRRYGETQQAAGREDRLAMPEPRARRGPLSRFTAVDLTRVRSGPTCVRQLADWGADVIMIETPVGLAVSDAWEGDRHDPDFQNLHRNKRCITLNLKDPEGIAVFRRLADRADVVVENFRPDVKFRLGIDYESLRQTNPRLVYV